MPTGLRKSFHPMTALSGEALPRTSFLSIFSSNKNLFNCCMQPYSMKQFTLALVLLALPITSCGLSSTESIQYKNEIKASGDRHKRLSVHFNKLIELNRKALSAQHLSFSGFTESKRVSQEMMAVISYSACLDGYMKAKEKFVIAKTNCTAESGLSRFN